jgi:hypothetical protein
MKEKEGFFKNLNPYLAIVIAMVCGLGSLYFGTKLIPVFFEVAELIDKGTPIGAKGAVVIGLLSMFGITTYFLALWFQLAQKRVIEEFYG